jgi:hypothetical protein
MGYIITVWKSTAVQFLKSYFVRKEVWVLISMKQHNLFYAVWNFKFTLKTAVDFVPLLMRHAVLSEKYCILVLSKKALLMKSISQT